MGRSLYSLAARALGSLTAELGHPPSAQVGLPSLPLWLALVRVVTPEPTGLPQVAMRSCVSRRVVRSAMVPAERGGWITVTKGEARSGPLLTLTPSGAAADQGWTERLGLAEARWSARRGEDLIRSARQELEVLVGQFELELPHLPISYGPADLRITGGQGADQPGTDWAPVARTSPVSALGLSLTALLSQAMVGFGVEYEAIGLTAVTIGLGLAQGFGARDAAPLAELPAHLAVAGNGRSGLERHGVVSVQADPAQPDLPIARLTSVGRAIRDSYPEVVAAIEASWRDRSGAAVFDRLRQALLAIDRQLDPSVPDHFLIRQVR